MAIVHIKTVEEFEKEVKNSDKPVIIDFWAQWCMPCKMFAPVFEHAAEEYKNVKFVKVDVDEAQDIAVDFSIYSIPTIAFVKDGSEVDRQLGALSLDMLKDFIGKNI